MFKAKKCRTINLEGQHETQLTGRLNTLPVEGCLKVIDPEPRSGCQQSWNGRILARVPPSRELYDVMNDANLSQGESERSERSQIEDVTNYCSNVAQGR